MGRKVISLVTILLLGILLTGCDNSRNGTTSVEQQPETEVPTQIEMSRQPMITIDIGDQTFHVISLFEKVRNYAVKVEENSTANRKELYDEEVVNPLKEMVAESNALTYDHFYQFLDPNTNTDKLIKLSEELMKEHKRIEELLQEALSETVGHLGGKDKVIILVPLNPEELTTIEDMNGVGGVALSHNTFVLYLDPSFDSQGLKYAIAHEYHHTVQSELNADGSNNYLESFILEGKADAFSNIVYPDYQAQWTNPLSTRLEEKVFYELKEAGTEFNLNIYFDFAYGNSSKGIPPWSNYKIGYRIVQSYLENHPNVPIEEWSGLLPKDIILGSDYRDIYQESYGIEE